jgi:hypothetical protein
MYQWTMKVIYDTLSWTLLVASDKQVKGETKCIQTNKTKQSASELYRLSDSHLSTKFSANFCG